MIVSYSEVVWERDAFPRMSSATQRRAGALTTLCRTAKAAKKSKTGISRQGRQERQEIQQTGIEPPRRQDAKKKIMGWWESVREMERGR